MAHHKDISRAHALLEGEGWHITSGSQRKTNKKDKRSCIYYNKNTKLCRKLKVLCMGTSDCTSYHK